MRDLTLNFLKAFILRQSYTTDNRLYSILWISLSFEPQMNYILKMSNTSSSYEMEPWRWIQELLHDYIVLYTLLLKVQARIYRGIRFGKISLKNERIHQNDVPTAFF